MTEHPDEAVKREKEAELAAALRATYAPAPQPPGPTADAYRLAGYTDGLLGATQPACDSLLPHYDSGLKWADSSVPQPDAPLWGGGVSGGVTWDGTFWRDLARYSAGGPLFWSAYFKPGTAPGMKQGYWLNFGDGWAHLASDDPVQILAGASQRLYHDTATGDWRLVIEATQFVTHAVIDVWTGAKHGGNDPVGIYTRVSGCDPVATLTMEAIP